MRPYAVILSVLVSTVTASFGQHKELLIGIRAVNIKGTNINFQGSSPEVEVLENIALNGSICWNFNIPVKQYENSSISIMPAFHFGSMFGGGNTGFGYTAGIPVSLNYRYGLGSNKDNTSRYGINVGMGAELYALAVEMNFNDSDGYSDVYVQPFVLVGINFKRNGKRNVIQYKGSIVQHNDEHYNTELDIHFGPRITYHEISWGAFRDFGGKKAKFRKHDDRVYY